MWRLPLLGGANQFSGGNCTRWSPAPFLGALLQQLPCFRSAAIQGIASAPEFIGVELHRVPVALQSTHAIDLAGYAAELAGLLALSCDG